jgi:hypothetical protein
MPSTQKLPKHDSHNSSTQDSEKAGSSSRAPYKSGANVHRGGGPKPSSPSPASEPFKGK